ISTLLKLLCQIAIKHISIAHTQVKALSGDRMDGMGSIAHQYHTANGLFFCQDLREWEAKTATGFLEFSGTITISVLQGIKKMLIIFIAQPFTFCAFFYRPDNGTAIFTRQWQ